jgi:hypothetical protein
MRNLASLLAAVALALTGCGGGDDETESPTAETETATEATSAGGCEEADAPEPREDGGASAPTEELEPGATYTLAFETNCGSFTITLDRKSAPETVASLVALAEGDFYDDTVFHRIVPGFVIQGGDPTQTGTGGPGYQTVDPPPASTAYTKGRGRAAAAGLRRRGRGDRRPRSRRANRRAWRRLAAADADSARRGRHRREILGVTSSA